TRRRGNPARPRVRGLPPLRGGDAHDRRRSGPPARPRPRPGLAPPRPAAMIGHDEIAITRGVVAVTVDLQEASAALRDALADAARGLVEREALLETVALGAIAGEHVLVIGPPGTGKSEAVRRVARATGGRYFEYLLGRFTEPSEIFGPIDLRRLKEGLVE